MKRLLALGLIVALALLLAACGGGNSGNSFTPPPPPLTITTASLANGVVGIPYSATLQATGGSAAITWSVASGSLPPGLSLAAATGVVSGTPTTAGDFSFTVQATAGSESAQKALANHIFRGDRNDSILTATPLSSGRFRASISPYADLNGNAGPDQDYYKITALAGSTVQVETFAARLTDVTSELDTVIEILDANGQRLAACNDPIDDTAGGFPIQVDPTPLAFDDICINDDLAGGVTDSQLTLLVPGTAGQPVTFYVHVFDWRGDARPDFIYDLSISGTGIQ